MPESHDDSRARSIVDEIVPLERRAVAEAAPILAAAFRDNPIFRAALLGVDDDGRIRKLVRLFRGFAGAGIAGGRARAAMVDGRIAAVALAYPPGGYPYSFAGWLRNGWGALSLGPGHTWRLARLDAFTRAHHFKAPHWYLFILGVAPSLQGRGVGGALLRDHFLEADRARLPCYLETDTPENVAYYQRFGYAIVAETQVPALRGVTLWLMLRPAMDNAGRSH